MKDIYFTIGVAFVSLSIILTILAAFFGSNNILNIISLKISDIIKILLLLGLFISYQTYVNNSKNSELSQQATLTEKSWVLVYDKIQSYYSKCPEFCNSLSFSWQIPKNVIVEKGGDDYGAVLSLSIYIFQSFASVLNYFLYSESLDIMNEWISSFILWANSDTLYDVWNKNKFIYGKTTIEFVDKIFLEVRKNPPKSECNIKEMSSKICKSDELKKIYKEASDKQPQCY